MGLWAWATQPISEEEGRARAERGFKVAVVGLLGAAVAASLAMADRWVFRDYENFALAWFGVFGLSLAATLVSIAMLSAGSASSRRFFVIASALSMLLCGASVAAKFWIPVGTSADKFEGSLLERERR
jgi:hypothetical protein